MKEYKLGIIMNGVTGRMGTNQHLIRSICAIRDQGGVRISPEEVITVDPILTGRNENKLSDLAERTGVRRWTTNLEEALADPNNQVFFDASSTLHRARFVEMAAKAG
ncbi:MAG: gfo/Idh/MocA family oxidoreductase, partial [Verrucomicrobiota bacterium]|nr:gfo/Idh/MocA family oxidoreductase [Verrucomicrobiota bacterium]